ncbi:MAG: sulfite exporter TauE/SafE family protein [Proteobacteria bacterium]|nr:sulfite exporter TauE/SafE family protein [Pseudomonadota bacterium]
MFDPDTLLLCAAALATGGFIKGIAGLGLPIVSIPLLTLAVDLPTAAVLLALPTTASNLFQTFQRGAFVPVVRRFWPLLLPFLPTIAIGAKLMVTLEPRILYVALGISVLAITLLTRAVPNLRVGPRLERALSPLVGTLSGLLGGASSLFGPPIMIYLLSLRLERDEYISAVSLIYLVAASLFTLSLIAVGALGWVQAWYSALAMIPVFGGMLIGQLIGARLGARAFERALTGLYVLTALTFFYKAFA